MLSDLEPSEREKVAQFMRALITARIGAPPKEEPAAKPAAEAEPQPAG